ncbi:glycerophosphodiester phosphodiesterase [Microbispora corallina]|uniref:Glycerophosphoryl diester phosphodiesterase n=1 Tax=Microbispora corallina TaxID=83302 RepID=A0ABQ4G749_9ACTN|nr:glycerophosphodiester phosphodiesterase family protein [Microbispora corallina]GIH42849.1 glycerophosphoryl diester phosphodiesterase [Microbispora corallina]
MSLTLVGHAQGLDGALARHAARTCAPPGVVAHRGDPTGGTENTLDAFRAAIEAGADTVELDVHFTRDHEPVLMHDATVDRTTTGTGRVSGMSLARFRTLRTYEGQRPPTLAAVMALVRDGGARMLVELKEVPDHRDLAALEGDYRRYGAYRWAPLMSFSAAALRAVRSIPAPQGLLATAPPPVATARGYAFVSVRHDTLSADRVRAYRAAGVPVYAWTPDDPASWRRLAGYGVTRVVTDRTSAYLDWAGAACGL